jgi:hypothetical protein
MHKCSVIWASCHAPKGVLNSNLLGLTTAAFATCAFFAWIITAGAAFACLIVLFILLFLIFLVFHLPCSLSNKKRWLNNCVGYKNYKFFFLFVAYITFSAWILLWVTGIKLIEMMIVGRVAAGLPEGIGWWVVLNLVSSIFVNFFFLSRFSLLLPWALVCRCSPSIVFSCLSTCFVFFL